MLAGYYDIQAIDNEGLTQGSRLTQGRGWSRR